MKTRLIIIIGIIIPAVVSAAGPTFHWQPEDPASWSAKNPAGHSAPLPPSGAGGKPEGRWNAREIARSLEQYQQREKDNQNWSIKANRERASRNPLCTDSFREKVVNDRSRSDYHRREANYSQICPPDSATFTFGD